MAVASDFLYFAYGSNLLTRRLRARTASAVPLGWAMVPDHGLRWHMASSDGSGKCDMVDAVATPEPVHGVVYRIDPAERSALDQAESLGVGYRAEQIPVRLGGRTLRAWVYRALRTDAGLLPYDWYHALVLAGASEHGLPIAYRQQLASVPTRSDADRQRAQRHFALVQAS
jgi:hypothetical protein